MLMRISCLCLVTVALIFAGCASQLSAVRLRVAGGQRIIVDMQRGGLVEGEKREVKVRMGGFMLNSEGKNGIYLFTLEFNAGDIPRLVKIEDVSDDKARILIEDQAPKLLKQIWAWKSEPQSPTAESLQWIHEIDDSFRVFRFTVELVDGRKFVQHQVSYYPAFVKARICKGLGLDAQ